MDHDLALVRAVRAGEHAAIQRLLGRITNRVWTVATLLTRDETEARVAFGDVMAGLQSNSFARLQGYQGRGRLETFVTLVVRDMLGERLVHLFAEDRQRGWKAFEHVFEGDIRRVIQRRLPGTSYDDARRDAYQEICAALVEEDFRRIRAYGGTGSFAGFVLCMVDRLAIDHVRQLNPRRRLPAAVERLPPLEQELFKLVYWRQLPADPQLLCSALRGRIAPLPETGAILAALTALRSALPANADPGDAQRRQMISISALTPEAVDAMIPDAGPTPEDQLSERQEAERLNRALEVLRQAADQLPPDERLYLTVALSGAEALSARDIAQRLRRPVAEVYKLKQRVLKRLKDAIEENSAVKNWRTSV